MTGIFACLISFNTGSHPVSTTGARMIASTPWATNVRSAWIWFSCLPWASENFRLTPRFLASDWIEFVSAVRQDDSAPICEKPTVRPLPAPPPPPPELEGPVEAVDDPPPPPDAPLSSSLLQPTKRVVAARQNARQAERNERRFEAKSRVIMFPPP